MPLIPTLTLFPVYEQGEYSTLLESVELSERQPFGSQDTTAKEPCFKFTFAANTGKLLDGKPVPLELDGKPVKFYIQTGVGYGGARSTLTKTTNQMVGRPLDNEKEAPYFDYEKLVGHGFKLLITKEPNSQGDMRNTVAGITPITPIDVGACLVSP